MALWTLTLSLRASALLHTCIARRTSSQLSVILDLHLLTLNLELLYFICYLDFVHLLRVLAPWDLGKLEGRLLDQTL